MRACRPPTSATVTEVAPLWTPAFALSELAAGESRVFVRGQQRIAVFHLASEAGRLAAIDDRLSGDAATTMMDDVIQPIHVHIDRIDIRLDVAAGASATATPRRAVAPVVALDDFLRRPAEGGQ